MFIPKPYIYFFRLLILLLLMIIAAPTLQAQDFDEWKKNYLNEFKEFQNEYDRQFYETLQKDWENFKSEHRPSFYKEPKPKKLPTIENGPPTKASISKKKEQQNPVKKGAKAEIQKPTQRISKQKENPSDNTDFEQKNRQAKTQKKAGKVSPASQKEERPNNLKGLTANFSPAIEQAEIRSNQLQYFGVPVNYKYYAAYETKLSNRINQDAIAGFWKHLSTKDYPSFLKQIKDLHNQLSLNDFGYAQLLYHVGEQIYEDRSNEATLFTWFMLTQSGFGTKLAYKGNKVHLLVKASPHVFSRSLTINGTKYYDVELGDIHHLPQRIYTYRGNHAKNKGHALDLLFQRLPSLPQEPIERSFTFTFRDSSYSIDVPIDIQTVNYFKNYPQADLDLYFNSQIGGETHNELTDALSPLLKGKSSLEQANLLLRFTQRAFDYRTDTEQFNEEKKMFPVEMLYYPASDCDDRSIMFGYLLDQLTDLDYIVLRYPRHLTIAVHFPDEKPSGERIDAPIIYNGKEYYVSDPTYMGADAGMIMPQYQGMQPSEIFDL